jgi:molybdenum cofactor guanylyltransferase
MAMDSRFTVDDGRADDVARRRGEIDVTAGIVLAGGQSRRFGPRDKLVANVNGQPLVRRVADALAAPADVDELVVSCRPNRMSALERALEGAWRSVESIEFVPDRVPDRGPLGGFEAALPAVGSRDVVVAAGDLPLVTVDVFDALLSEHDGECTIAVTADGRRQPLCAVYRRVPTAAAVEATLETETASASALLERLDVEHVRVALEAGRRDPLANVNTSADLRQVRDRCSGEIR